MAKSRRKPVAFDLCFADSRWPLYGYAQRDRPPRVGRESHPFDRFFETLTKGHLPFDGRFFHFDIGAGAIVGDRHAKDIARKLCAEVHHFPAVADCIVGRVLTQNMFGFCIGQSSLAHAVFKQPLRCRRRRSRAACYQACAQPRPRLPSHRSALADSSTSPLLGDQVDDVGWPSYAARDAPTAVRGPSRAPDMVPEPPTRSAMAAHARPLCGLDFGDHAPADQSRYGHTLL